MLVYGLVIMTVVSIVLTGIVTVIYGQVKYALQVHAREQAFQIAESGIHFYRWYLAHQVEGRTAQQVEDFWTGGTAYGVNTDYEAAYVDESGSIGGYRLHVDPPVDGSTSVTVTSTGWATRYPSLTRTIVVRFRKPVWSEDIVLANDNMRFGEGTEVYGKIHSNFGIRFDGVAHNTVTSSLASYDDPDHNDHTAEFGVHTHVNVPPATGTTSSFRSAEAPPNTAPDRSDVFEAGRSFPVPTADFNGVLGDLAYMKSIAQAGTGGSRYFNNANQGRHIILKTNDTFDIRTVQSYVSSTNQINNYTGGWSTYAIPDDGVIFVENNVWLEGAIDGKRVTIVAANLLSSSLKSMHIGKDIRYTNYDCTDILGIIGQNDVEIYRGSETDLRIDGALLAQSGRVGRDNYGTSDHKDVITVYGAIATNQRYGFSWTNGIISWGYTDRNLYYDNNLLYCPPPYFPSGTQYEMDLWEER